MSAHHYKILWSAIISCCLLQVSSFTVGPARQSVSRPSLGLAALTERQMQFWEDVEDGLNDVEQVYASKGQNIDRIRTFGKR